MRTSLHPHRVTRPDLRAILVSVAVLLVAITLVIAPGAFPGIIALTAFLGLLAFRLRMMHAGWPPRLRAPVRAREA
jgi:hypothetical protein